MFTLLRDILRMVSGDLELSPILPPTEVTDEPNHNKNSLLAFMSVI